MSARRSDDYNLEAVQRVADALSEPMRLALWIAYWARANGEPGIGRDTVRLVSVAMGRPLRRCTSTLLALRLRGLTEGDGWYLSITPLGVEAAEVLVLDHHWPDAVSHTFDHRGRIVEIGGSA